MTALSDVDAVIFDFDGVLVESVDVKTRAFAHLFEPYGPEVVAQVVAHHQHHGGVSRFEKFRYYYNHILGEPISDDELGILARRFSEIVVDEVISAPFVRGAERFLIECSRQVPCFVVSGTPQDELRDIIRRRRMTDYFREVFGVPATKTENVQHILDRHRLSAIRVTFFGDAEADWIAARDTGTVFVGVVRAGDHPLACRSGFLKIADFTELQLK